MLSERSKTRRRKKIKKYYIIRLKSHPNGNTYLIIYSQFSFNILKYKQIEVCLKKPNELVLLTKINLDLV